ncbi:MFS transporter, partial [Marinilabilia sp.]
GSYRMVGAFAGGMLVQGALLFLVAHFGNINPTIDLLKLDEEKYEVTVSAPKSVENVNIKTEDGVALFTWLSPQVNDSENKPTKGKSFSMEANKEYAFMVEGEPGLDKSRISIIDQKQGYSYSIYIMSVLLALSLFITFYTTRERVLPPKSQETNLLQDLKDLIRNRPWIILLVIGLLFNVYNSIKQGITVIYFSHYLHDQLLAGTYMVLLMVASIGGAMVTSPLGRKLGKRQLFIYALIFSGGINALIAFCGPDDTAAIFTIGILSEFGAAIFPTLFFAMLGDAADYSEFKNGRRATGLVYSAGSFATKFGGGLAGAIIGLVLTAFHYDGQDAVAIEGAVPGIVMLMSWIPTVIAIVAAGLMKFYPLDQDKLDEITTELNDRRARELG